MKDEPIALRTVFKTTFPDAQAQDIAAHAKTHAYLGVRTYLRESKDGLTKVEFQTRNAGKNEAMQRIVHFCVNWALQYEKSKQTEQNG